jgi:hypothetical protein
MSQRKRADSATAAVSGTSTPAMSSDMTSALSALIVGPVLISMLTATVGSAPPSSGQESLK